MKIPNFASLYHSGTSYWRSDCQSARNGPCWIPLITCSKMAARSESYLLLARFQTWSIASGGSDAVGASESELARMTDEFEMKKPRTSANNKDFRVFGNIASPLKTTDSESPTEDVKRASASWLYKEPRQSRPTRSTEPVGGSLLIHTLQPALKTFNMRNSSSPVGVHSEFGVSLGQSFFSSGLGNGASHKSPLSSEVKLQSNLHLAFCVCGGRDDAKKSGTVWKKVVRSPHYRRIGRVESFGSELKSFGLGYGERPEQ